MDKIGWLIAYQRMDGSTDYQFFGSEKEAKEGKKLFLKKGYDIMAFIKFSVLIEY